MDEMLRFGPYGDICRMDNGVPSGRTDLPGKCVESLDTASSQHHNNAFCRKSLRKRRADAR
jgi:hypothetical protein